MSSINQSNTLLTVDPSTGFVICIPCKSALPSIRRSREHLTKHHKLSSNEAKSQSSTAFSTSASISFKVKPTTKRYLDAPTPLDHNFLPPLPNLLIESGYQCSSCSSCFKNELTMKSHLKKQHYSHHPSLIDQHWDNIKKKGTIKLQSIYSGNKTCFFPVTEPLFVPPSNPTPPPPPPTPQSSSTIPSNTPSNINSPIGTLLKSVMNNTNAETPTEANRNKMNPFIGISKCDEILSANNISIKDAFYFSVPSIKFKSIVEFTISEDIKKYLFFITSIRSSIAPSTLSAVNLRDTNEFTLVSQSSVERYTRDLIRLVISAYRMKDHHALPSFVKSSLTTYLNHINQSSPVTSNSYPLHSLIKSICLCHLQKYQGSQPLFIRIFVSCSTVLNDARKKDNLNLRFAEAHEISPLLSALQYSISTCCIREIHIIGEDASALENPSQSQIDAFKQRENLACKSLSLSENTAACYVRNTLNLATKIIGDTKSDVNFEDCVTHTCCGIIDGIHLSLPEQGNIVKSLHSKIDAIIKERLLFNSPLPPHFLSKLASLTDDLSVKSSGFSFLRHKDSEKWVFENMNWLLSELQENPRAKASLFPSPSNPLPPSDITNVEGIKFRTKGIDLWLQACQDIQEALLACIHISSGLPARSTELETMNISNTIYSTRNVFISQSDLVLITRYSKPRTMTKSDRPITRILDKETSYRIKLYLSLLRGLECTMIGSIYGLEAMKSHWISLFAKNGTPFKHHNIRSIIVEAFINSNLNIQFSQIRHHASAMVRKVSNSFKGNITDDIERNLYTLGHLQAGHSVDTSERIYGRRDSDFLQLSYSDLSNTRVFCSQWHQLLGLSPCSYTSPQLSIPMHSSPLKLSTPNTQPPQSPNINKQHSHPPIQPKEIFPLTSPRLKRMKTTHLINTPPPSNVHIRSSKSDLFTINPTPYLSALRSILNNNEATFKSQLQLSVTIDIFKKSDNLLIVMPTGSGKSLCFLIPIYMEATEYCSILIEPLRSLVNEMTSRAQSIGIQTGGWEDRKDTRNIQLFILSAEHVSHKYFPSLVNSLQSSNRLARIIFDEAHLGLLWQDFRPALRYIKTGLVKSNIQCNTILLTATSPPSIQNSLISHFGLTDITVHRAPTVRKNLFFKVINVDNQQSQRNNGQFTSTEDNILNTIASLVGRKMFSLKNHVGKIMIFSLTKDLSIKLYNHLKESYGNPLIKVFNYHSGMTDSEREHTHSLWSSPSSNHDDIRIMSCTSAFGTGLDFPDVHAVYHAGAAYGIPEYIQEAGRAGRNGQPADCILAYSPSYASKFGNSMEGLKSESMGISEEEHEIKLSRWSHFLSYANNTSSCRKSFLYRFVDDHPPGHCLFDSFSINCDFCDRLDSSIKPSSSTTLPINNNPQPQLQQPPPSLTDITSVDQDLMETILPFQPTQSSLPSQPTLSKSFESNPSTPSQTTLLIPPKSTLETFRAVARRLESHCVYCLIIHSKRVSSNHHNCAEKKSRCLRCQSNLHFVRTCFQQKSVNGHCFKCLLRNCEGEPVHINDFGGDCQYGICKDLSWLLWQSTSWRENIVEALFDHRMKEKYHSLSPDNEKASSSLFYSWISNISRPIPNIIRLVLWWDEKRNH